MLVNKKLADSVVGAEYSKLCGRFHSFLPALQFPLALLASAFPRLSASQIARR